MKRGIKISIIQEGNAHHQILEIVLITLFKDFKGRELLKLYWDFCIPQFGSRIDVMSFCISNSWIGNAILAQV